MKKFSRPLIYSLAIIVLVVFIFLFFLAGENHKNEKIAQSNPRNLLLEFVPSDSNNSIKYNPEDLANNYYGTIQYFGYKKVSVYIETDFLDLREAIQSGKVTVEEIISHARSDTTNGFCLEKKTSKNGLTTFSYLYYDFDLTYIDDIYETPDGKQHYIQYLGIYPAGESRNISHSYYDDSTLYPYKLDREDWGLTLELLNVTPEKVIIQAIQNKGQQIGTLEIIDFSIYSSEKPLFTINFNSTERVSITKNGVSEFVVSWEDRKGSLESGEYLLVLNIEDVYTPSDVHPLMKNFYDKQRYYLNLKIP